jgi:hypothetical protein
MFNVLYELLALDACAGSNNPTGVVVCRGEVHAQKKYSIFVTGRGASERLREVSGNQMVVVQNRCY